MTLLQETLSKVQAIVFQDRQAPNEAILTELKRILLPQIKKEEPSPEVPKRKLPVSIGATSGGSYSIFGPTSAFYNLVEMNPNSASVDPFDNMLMNSSSLITCLENFFKFQYPDIATFIHRESFLNDFFHPLTFKGWNMKFSIPVEFGRCSLEGIVASDFRTVIGRPMSRLTK